MKEFLKIFGVWEIVINAYVPSKKQSKASTKREVRKNDSTTLKFILDELPSSIKKSVGECTSAQDIWSKLEKEYHHKRQDIEKSVEEKPTEDMKQESLQDSDGNEGKNPPESICRHDEEDWLKLKDDIATMLEEMEYNAGYSNIEIDKHSFYEFKNKMLETLEKYQEGIMILKQLLKQQEGNETDLRNKLKEQEEEITKLKSKRLEQE